MFVRALRCRYYAGMAPAALDDDRLLARLVSFDTTSCNPTTSIAEFLADYLSRAGADVRLLPYVDGKVNLLARVGPETAGGIMLSGHLDVVPATEDDWASDPFTLTSSPDRYVGRFAVSSAPIRRVSTLV